VDGQFPSEEVSRHYFYPVIVFVEIEKLEHDIRALD